METRFLAIGTLTVLSTVAAAAAVSSWRHGALHLQAAPGAQHLLVFGSRGDPAQSSSAVKFDGPLADLSRHASLARPGHAIDDLRSLAPAVKFKLAADGTPLVLIDAVTLGDPQQLKAALVASGLQQAAVYSNDVSGWLPVAQLKTAEAQAEVHALRASLWRARSGAITSQGDFAQHSDVVRSANSLSGAGVTVGVLSDSYDCYSVYASSGVPASGNAGYASNGFLATAADDISSGDLPATVNILKDADCPNYGAPTQLPFGDEGRAMMQIVHDVAPGAALAFYTAEGGEADYASGIGKLATAGAKVIVDDVGYFDEPFFQDGLIAQAVDAVNAQGVAYFSAAGNDGNSSGSNVALAYDNNAPSFATVSSAAPNSGEHLLNFDTSKATTTTKLPVTIASLVPGEFVAIVVEWDQPYVTGATGSGGATTQIDVCITGASGTDQIEGYATNPIVSSAGTCSGANKLGSDPYQILIVGNPANAAGNTASETINIQVGVMNGTPAPGRIKLAVEDDGAGSKITAFGTNSATLQGHPGAAGAFAVGAAFYFDTPACGTTPAQIEPFSSSGGDPILFDVTGTRLATPIARQKPDAVGPNGGNDTFLGFTLADQGLTGGMLNTTIASCQNNPSFPNFFGTSAAAPHVAGIAALLLEADAAATPTQIFTALRSTALAMGSPSPNVNSGYGFVQADAALATIPHKAVAKPAAPTLALSPTSITLKGSTTITWSSVDAASCLASGNWSGTLASAGTQTLTPTSAGTDSYTLVCSNGAGASAATTVTLTVAAADTTPSFTGHGGGGVDVWALMGLAGLGAARLLRSRARVLP